ncbi:hypothetical protein GCM10010219_18700 [Streptomyces netropsis]|nr:hypothetical protein GCM10010219_18700 [Streptomyces netropsis]
MEPKRTVTAAIIPSFTPASTHSDPTFPRNPERIGAARRSIHGRGAAPRFNTPLDRCIRLLIRAASKAGNRQYSRRCPDPGR